MTSRALHLLSTLPVLVSPKGGPSRLALYNETFRSRTAIPETAVPSVDATIPALHAPLNDTAALHALAAVTRSLAPETIFEIGTYQGDSARIFAANSDATVYTLDLPLDATADVNDRDARIIDARTETSLPPRCVQLRGDSLHFDFAPYRGRIDLVYVDGGHSRANVESDTANAFAMLRAGGSIVWDDYAWFYPDVVEFLDRLATDKQLARLAGTNLVIHRTR